MSAKTNMTTLVFSVVLLHVFLVSPVLSACTIDHSYYPPREVCVDDGLLVGVVILIVLGPILLLVGLGILICFCCGVCCFKGRKRQQQGQVYAGPQVNTVQMPYQHQPSEVVVNANYPTIGSTPYPTAAEPSVHYTPNPNHESQTQQY